MITKCQQELMTVITYLYSITNVFFPCVICIVRIIVCESIELSILGRILVGEVKRELVYSIADKSHGLLTPNWYNPLLNYSMNQEN